MAKTKIGGITVEIGADTSDLSKKLKDVNTESKKTTSELKSIDAALKQAPNSVELWKQKQEALAKSVENSKKKLEALVSEQENLKKGLEQGTVTEEAYKAYQREIEITKGQIEQAEKALNDFTNAEDKAGDAAKETGKDLEKSGKEAEDSSEGYTVLKNAVANLAADGFEKLMKSAKEAWEELDAGYDTIATKTGATGETLNKLQRSADAVFTSLPVDMTETSEAIGEINTRFQATDKELESLTENFLKYSNINGTQVANSVRNVSGIMKAYQEDVSNTGKVLDVLSDVSHRTGKDINSLESELLSNADTFKEMGFDIRQSAELLGQFESNGIEASTAMAGLKKAQQNATADGKTMNEALAETLQNIKNAKTETEALQIAQDLFGKKGAASMTQAVREQRFSIDDLTAGYNDMRDVVNETFEATQDAPDKAKIALNKLKLELAQLAEAVLPKIEKLVDKGVQNLPKIEKTVKDMLPYIKAIGTAYASWKIASTAVKGAEAVSGLAKAMKSAETATAAMNSTLLANPAVAVTAGIVALTVAIGALIVAQKEEFDISKEVTDQYKQERDAAEAAGEEIAKMKDDFNTRARDIENESKRTEALWKELDELADASGRVKDSDKKRAEYILGELNQALGTEYTMTDNQIDKYQQLAAEIDTVIAKKKSEALLDQYMTMNSAMVQQNAEAQANYEKYKAQSGTLRSAMAAAEADYNTALETRGLSPEDYRQKYQAYLDAKAAVVENDNLMQQSKALFESSLDYVHKLDDAEKAFSEERYDDVKDILYTEKNANKEILNDTKSSLQEREEAYNNSLQKVYADISLYSQNWRQKEADAIMEEMGEVVEAGKLAGEDADKAFTKEFKDGVQKMLNKGFDISKLAKWAKNSGVDVGEVFGDDYTKVVQEQLDKGYDIMDLLQWGANSGVDVGAMFTDEFTKKFQNQLNTGFDVSSFLSWAAEKGYEVGDVFGKNFESAYNRYLYDHNDLINEHSINSQADYEYWKSQGYDFHAAGGFIPYGSKGIVAEAGPELLEVMNGGVRVTNLTPSDTNTSIGAGKTTNNYYYNTVNAAIGSRYDVYKLAEDLDTAEHRLNMGKGR